MSKAFTKEDDDAGIEPVFSARGIPHTAFRLTPAGARKLERDGDPRVRDALKLAELVQSSDGIPERAALGVSVVVEDEHGEQHEYRLVSPEERALVGEGCSVESPIGRALLGAVKGDVREVTVPRGPMEIEVLSLRSGGN
ncbi:MAG TPA: GreA/GreB family elongation factor [Polyangiaceae bacterium]|nr:GreA/GreB family elongation factor [Polyangiaceae bacterium]